jgi:hypothetical protein
MYITLENRKIGIFCGFSIRGNTSNVRREDMYKMLFCV